jgi:serine/threonine-protein kinase
LEIDSGWLANSTITDSIATPRPDTGRARSRWLAPAVVVLALTLAMVPFALGWFSWVEVSPVKEGPAPAATETVEHGFELLAEGYRKGNAERAARFFEERLAAGGPAAEGARVRVGLCRAFLWRFQRSRDPLWQERALEQGQLAVAADPHLAEGLRCLALALLAADELEEARGLTEEALRLDPLHAEGHRLLGQLALRGGREEEALEAVGRALELDPEDWETHELMGFLALQGGRPEEGVEALSRAAELAPANAEIFKNLGAAYFRLGREDEAAAAFQRSLEIEPYAATYTNLGTLEFYRGRYVAALHAFEKAVEQGANHYLNWANLGDALRFTPGRTGEAETAFRRAIQLLEEAMERRPGDRELESRMALYLAKAGDTGAALRLLESLGLGAEDLASDLPEGEAEPRLLYRAVLIYEINGQRDAALAALEEALEAGYPTVGLRYEPELDALRQDVGYQLLLADFQQ